MSEIIVLDTHIWFWFVNGDFDQFPVYFRERIEQAAMVGVSPVSCFEIALARQKGRLSLPCETRLWLKEALEPAGIDLFPLSPDISSIAVDLAQVHKDPFDRIIIATALEYKATLASMDGMFFKYPELNDCLMKKG
ncbi:MAG: type II toxin-antitoxin system VapC family toxin [Desulfobacteraceae bacterium]|jgi:PIN domain nuclease of toxin-antitoxin system